MEERCVCCGDIIPEGRQVCPLCEYKTLYCRDCEQLKRDLVAQIEYGKRLAERLKATQNLLKKTRQRQKRCGND